MARPRLTLSTVVLQCVDAHELADFYRELLGWQVQYDEPEWVKIVPPGGGTGLSFQAEAGYVRPVWPEVVGEQQMMMNLDVEVDDLAVASVFVAGLGGDLASHQPQDDTRVFLDPAGHPFCLWVAS